ncbi:MAG: GTP pyrophosphokinase [Desulfobulbus propionicus]|nr:MAG: GTP pyrophosphokinase [Desulfobulbus propionicus]
MTDINTLLAVAGGYLPEEDLTLLVEAYNFSRKRHARQKHASGEPYINHLVEVASCLAGMKLDQGTIIAGLLHGTLKEEVATFAELKKHFGDEVARLVEGATRITNVRYNSQLVHQAKNIRKLLLAIGADIRVLLVKLADRLQDMVTMDGCSEEIRRQKSRETMDLYAPLASRLGIDWMKRELEDLSFKYLFPKEYAELAACLESTVAERQLYVDEVIAVLHEKLRDNQVFPIRVIGRPKHMYSIYKKLVAQRIPVEKVYDKVAFRIIVTTVKECYEALGVVHGEWTPVPGRIKDFVSTPKANNYQSLHTTVSGPYGHFIEIQIRTENMDKVAQEGVAAHWAYKEGQEISDADARLFSNLKDLVQILQEVEDPREFMDMIRGELFEPDVYALTPTGEVRELPRGATPIDFAYAIHSDVGDTCAGAKVNGHIVQLKQELQSGDIVEIITQKNQYPKRAWLQYVKTPKARTRIRQWLRREERENALKLGREICEKELKKFHVSIRSLVKGGHLRLMLKELRCASLDDLLVKVGTGNISIPQLIRALQPEEFKESERKKREKELLERTRRTREHREKASGRDSIDIDGIDDMLVKISPCCSPVPGDAVMGFITQGAGISIHRNDCPNLLNSDSSRWIEVTWGAAFRKLHKAALYVRAEDRKNLLADISSAIGADDAGISEISAKKNADNIVEIKMVVEVVDVEQLRRVLQHLRQMSAVIEVLRM